MKKKRLWVCGYCARRERQSCWRCEFDSFSWRGVLATTLCHNNS